MADVAASTLAKLKKSKTAGNTATTITEFILSRRVHKKNISF